MNSRQPKTMTLLVISQPFVFTVRIPPATISMSVSQSLQILPIRGSPHFAATANSQECREQLAPDVRQESQSATTKTPPRQRSESQIGPSISALHINAAI